MGVASLAVALCAALALPPPASAGVGRCPGVTVGGASIGTVRVDGVEVPIKPVRMASDGSLDGAPSARVASLVVDYRPLSASAGTSVLLWHSRYGPGCDGALNLLLRKAIGARVTVTDAAGQRTDYRITASVDVPKGAYRTEWFDWFGPRQLVLVTCTGLRDGVFTRNRVIVTEPAPPRTAPGAAR